MAFLAVLYGLVLLVFWAFVLFDKDVNKDSGLSLLELATYLVCGLAPFGLVASGLILSRDSSRRSSGASGILLLTVIVLAAKFLLGTLLALDDLQHSPDFRGLKAQILAVFIIIPSAIAALALGLAAFNGKRHGGNDDVG